MKKNRDSVFKTAKNRVGKQHLRKFKSEDEKLLSDLSRVKKTVKLTTQSISINKDSLNVTSRRLTFPELVGRSRHTSENVRNHSLLGLIEFVRRYEEEGRLNVYTLIQISCSMIFNESNKLRTSSKNLLLLVLSTYFSNDCNNSCSEMIYLYLKQGIICCNRSSDSEFYDDVYGLVGLIVDKFPWVLREYYEKLLNCLLSNTPELLSFNHFNCVYSLFKLKTSIDLNTRNELIEYVINTQYKILSNSQVNDNYKVTNGNLNNLNVKSSKLNEKGVKSVKYIKKHNYESNVNEIECLSISSMVVKSFKLLLSNSDYIKHNDQRVVDLMLTLDLFEFENMTERGKQTYERLFSDYVMTKVDLAIKLISMYTKHYVPLVVPLIQAESLKDAIESSRVAEIVFKVHLSRVDRILSCNIVKNKLNTDEQANVKIRLGKKDASLTVTSECVNKILSILSGSKLKSIHQLKNYLHKSVSGRNSSMNKYKMNNGDKQQMINTHTNMGSEDDDYGTDVDGETVEYMDVKVILVNLYYEVINSMLKSVLKSPSVWPFICYIKGVSPVVFPEIFNRSHYWSYLNSSNKRNESINKQSDTLEGLNDSMISTNHMCKQSHYVNDIKYKDSTDGDEQNDGGSYNVGGLNNDTSSDVKLEINFEEVMSYFMENIGEDMKETFIKMCLYISINDLNTDFYYKLGEIKNLKKEDYILLSKVYLNMKSTSKLNEYLSKIITELYRKRFMRPVKEFVNVLLFHLFNIKSEGRLDEQGRVVINYDVLSEVTEKVEYFMKLHLNLIVISVPDDETDDLNAITVNNDGVECSNGVTNDTDSNKGEKNSAIDKDDSDLYALMNYMMKTLINKYLMVMCNIENSEDMNTTIKRLIEDSVRPNYEKIEKKRRKSSYKVLKEVLLEYMDKESVPEWITEELEK